MPRESDASTDTAHTCSTHRISLPEDDAYLAYSLQGSMRRSSASTAPLRPSSSATSARSSHTSSSGASGEGLTASTLQGVTGKLVRRRGSASAGERAEEGGRREKKGEGGRGRARWGEGEREGKQRFSLADFKIGRPIGKGKFGNVFLAKTKREEKVVAIKVLFKSQLKVGSSGHT